MRFQAHRNAVKDDYHHNEVLKPLVVDKGDYSTSEQAFIAEAAFTASNYGRSSDSTIQAINPIYRLIKVNFGLFCQFFHER
jgi:hypothetical protein